jgi:hypothetical protein
MKRINDYKLSKVVREELIIIIKNIIKAYPKIEGEECDKYTSHFLT